MASFAGRFFISDAAIHSGSLSLSQVFHLEMHQETHGRTFT
jgi:hypothetical protein